MNKLYKRIRRAADVRNDNRMMWNVNRSESERGKLENICLNTCVAIERDVAAYCKKNHLQEEAFYQTTAIGQELKRFSRQLQGMARAFHRG